MSTIAAVQTAGDPLRSQWASDDADDAAAVSFLRDHLPPGWTVDINCEAAEWTATVLHGSDPEGWPVFVLTRLARGIGFSIL